MSNSHRCTYVAKLLACEGAHAASIQLGHRYDVERLNKRIRQLCNSLDCVLVPEQMNWTYVPCLRNWLRRCRFRWRNVEQLRWSSASARCRAHPDRAHIPQPAGEREFVGYASCSKRLRPRGWDTYDAAHQDNCLQELREH